MTAREMSRVWQRALQPSFWRRVLVPITLAGTALALAVVGAVLTERGEGIGGLNSFVERLSGRSGTFLGDTASAISLGFALSAGMVSAVNPCGFAMLPTYLGLYMGAQEQKAATLGPIGRLSRALVVGGAVTAGFVVLFGAAGLIIGGGTRSIVGAFEWIGLTIGILLTLVGAWLLAGGKLYSGMAARAAAKVGDPAQVGPRGYFLFGISYGTASLSCTLPIFLAVVGGSITLSSLPNALTEFALYGLGMGIVILALTLSMALVKGAVVAGLRRALPLMQFISPAFMVLAGMYITYYWLTIGGLLDKI
jgi:cytochrome c biogenesis protein CcdA